MGLCNLERGEIFFGDHNKVEEIRIIRVSVLVVQSWRQFPTAKHDAFSHIAFERDTLKRDAF